jgi:hypothetical protein
MRFEETFSTSNKSKRWDKLKISYEVLKILVVTVLDSL